MVKKQRQYGFENLPVCAGQFIELVIKKMRYRKKIRAEVAAELGNHFEDELKDCKTEDQKQQLAEKLIEEFGDAKMLGKLMRKAKKRCRPLWRTMIVRSFQAIGILILCLVIYIGWFLSGKPIITTNYVEVMNETVKPFVDVDPNLNARPFYNEAAELIELHLPERAASGNCGDEPTPVEDKQDWPLEMISRTDYEDTNSADKQIIMSWLEDNEHIFDIVAAGSRLPYYWPEYKTGEKEDMTGAIAVLIPHLAEYRTIVKTICWRAYNKAEFGDYQSAFDDILMCYRMGKHLKSDLLLIEQLVGISIEALAAGTVSNILDQYDIDSKTLAKFQGDFEQLIADEDFAVSFEQERLCLYDEIQRSFTVDKIGGGHLYLKRVRYTLGLMGYGSEDSKTFKGILKILFAHPNKAETLASIKNYYGKAEELAMKSPASILNKNIDIDKELENLGKENFFLEFLAPALGRVSELGHRNKVGVQAVPLIIAIHRYKADFGKLPASGDELLKAGYIKNLPIDPYSDKPLIYKATEDRFTVYGVGLNFVDDGGEIYTDQNGRQKRHSTKEGGDMVFWPID